MKDRVFINDLSKICSVNLFEEIGTKDFDDLLPVDYYYAIPHTHLYAAKCFLPNNSKIISTDIDMSLDSHILGAINIYNLDDIGINMTIINIRFENNILQGDYNRVIQKIYDCKGYYFRFFIRIINTYTETVRILDPRLILENIKLLFESEILTKETPVDIIYLPVLKIDKLVGSMKNDFSIICDGLRYILDEYRNKGRIIYGKHLENKKLKEYIENGFIDGVMSDEIISFKEFVEYNNLIYKYEIDDD
ncbi:hypothetical protein CWI38_0144p0070 [Hamiltosporidium tvaerminnensis]|uniref:Uncharacterized protein n=1 Tax=Hamiltosporidium tvaerminnensis TaxID=1176355 RepID=A0A4Q9L030_9MICR|nr:hypothetical protein CWI37_0933p0010 [Hamiltosporidium tvaerminnensis]TBU20039.1 hypothetical protein CWI38_0144p0070 [Hamiltosporidium tvaerminnensis]